MEWKKGICGVCPAGCWIEACLKDNILVDIRPDLDHSLGMMCRRGQHAVEIVYSPHRIAYPLKRAGPKGSYQFERISWDSAYNIIGENLNKIKKESGPEAVVIYTGRGAQERSLCDMFQPKGVMISSASNVLFPFGSPNTTGVGALCYVSLHIIAPHVTMGRTQPDMFTDIENAETVFVWGTNPATDSPPTDMHRLEIASRRGAKIIVIDPRRTETVTRTNAQWVPIRPGTDGALALSMIQVLIDNELYDEEFAGCWCHGFDELKQYVQHFSPEVVETITKVPAETIRNLANLLAGPGGVSLLMYTGLEYSNTGVQSARAVHTLFALAGQLDVPGGIGLAMLNNEFPINHSTNLENPNLERSIGRKEFPIYTGYREESHAISLVDAVLKGKPYEVHGLLIHGSSMLTSWPQTPVWREVLSRISFLVCIDRQLTADAAYADIVLPATTMFENYSYMVYGPIFRIREKLIDPLSESRNDYLIMAGLASQLGYGHLFPQSEEDMIRLALNGSGYNLEQIKAAGGWVRIPTKMMEFKKWQKGGLRTDGKPGFNTPTGKFEIWSTILEKHGYEPLPKYIEPVESPVNNPRMTELFPLVLNSGARPQTDFRSQHHGIIGLVKDDPEPTVDINSIDAAARSINNGDLVKVSSARGSVVFKARVTPDIIKGAVECSFGGGTPVGPKEWQDRNVNELTDLFNFDLISGFPIYKALLCQVVKVQAGLQWSETITESLLPLVSFPGTKEFSRSIYHVYLDNNATTEIDEDVRQAMLPHLSDAHGNPSGIYQLGRAAHQAIESARRLVASLINASPRSIVFTSGGSEACNLALKGVALSNTGKRKHIITTKIEHPAVLKTCGFLENLGYEISYLSVDENGWLHPDSLKSVIKDDTLLVSIMSANNETGTILPIAELAAITHEKGVIFHTDAVQAVGKIKVDVATLAVDMLSLSAHKFHGPKGIGALYINKKFHIEPLIHGGKQESGLRAGTENVTAIAGLGKAAELAALNLNKSTQLRDKLEGEIKRLYPGARLNGHPEKRLWNTLNLTLPGLRGESVVIAMDQHGISLSSGSACKSGSPEPTHVLMAMGRSEEEAHCSVRFSLSRHTTDEDINKTISAFSEVLEERSMVRLMPCK